MTYNCCHLNFFALLTAVAYRVALSCTSPPVESISSPKTLTSLQQMEMRGIEPRSKKSFDFSNLLPSYSIIYVRINRGNVILVICNYLVYLEIFA